MNGGRAERNEYILLHEFHRLKYIVPDKQYGKKAAPVVRQEDDDPDAPKTKGKKDKYKGGLVFEPKRGLWDKYILVMDFNSLYPSIIQEYNIDFTTVEQFEVEEVSLKLLQSRRTDSFCVRTARRKYLIHLHQKPSKVFFPDSLLPSSSDVDKSSLS